MRWSHFMCAMIGCVFAAEGIVANPVATGLRAEADAGLITLASVVRPQLRPDTKSAIQPTLAASNAGLQNWISSFRARALSAGINSRTFDRAFQGVQYDAKVIERDRNQSEFTKTIWEYLDTAASDARVSNGKEALSRQRDVLEAIEARYGVEKEVVVALSLIHISEPRDQRGSRMPSSA